MDIILLDITLVLYVEHPPSSLNSAVWKLGLSNLPNITVDELRRKIKPYESNYTIC